MTTDQPSPPLRQQLLARRVQVGLSQQQLGDLFGVRQNTISRLESGAQTLSAEWIERLVVPLRARVVIDASGSTVHPDES